MSCRARRLNRFVASSRPSNGQGTLVAMDADDPAQAQVCLAVFEVSRSGDFLW
jgi:hypothetical protein